RWPLTILLRTSTSGFTPYEPLVLFYFPAYRGTRSTVMRSKINRLPDMIPRGTVALSQWLICKGYSHDLQKRYRGSHWLTSIGNGAMIRSGDKVGYEGAVYALQEQLAASIHPGGRTALSLHGKAHYLELGRPRVCLFGQPGERLPTWFRQHGWGADVEYHRTNLLPAGAGVGTVELSGFSIKASKPTRALMECLYLATDESSYVECGQLMEGLNNVRPAQVQKLLEACTSVKVKRMFLYLAELAGHQWANHLNHNRIDLGSGKRSLVKGGAYVARYDITVPRTLA
ncbi:type IV toxin-antitoxin system AbiEi family antitoxin, partial [Sinorhizobium fredii]